MNPSRELIETLRQAQRFGFFGDRAIEEAVDHSFAYVHALVANDELATAGGRLLDLGSGGGLPGLVIAEALPHLDVVLLDRRQKRTDFLERAVRRLDLSRVTVRHGDATAVVLQVTSGEVEPFDVVTARGFGPPEFTLRTAVGCLAPAGQILISEPPQGDRWDPELLRELGLESERQGAVRVFRPW